MYPESNRFQRFLLSGLVKVLEAMQRIAAPMIGGMVTATVLPLLVIPALYYIWKQWEGRIQFSQKQ
ncbi:MAG: hypothetical protein KC587_16320 [Nitrospira sp.]|nr:hypothetical protein [Nitrospira sp.]